MNDTQQLKKIIDELESAIDTLYAIVDAEMTTSLRGASLWDSTTDHLAEMLDNLRQESEKISESEDRSEDWADDMDVADWEGC